jgi:2-amino-4-hydroxy-6-hydroxymethyldihydropteridine diphosphokinase
MEPRLMRYEVYLGLGSNLGDRRRRLGDAVGRLGELGEDVRVSGLYETEPQGFAGQPAFLNAACRIWTRLDPFELLGGLKALESGAGAGRAFVNGPRPLDVDILVYGRLVLAIPHPRMAERRFVLAPLAEIAPGLRHPVLGKTMASLLRDLTGGASPVARTGIDREAIAENIARNQMEYVFGLPYQTPAYTYTVATSPSGLVTSTSPGYTVSAVATSSDPFLADPNFSKIIVTVSRDGNSVKTLETFRSNQ